MGTQISKQQVIRIVNHLATSGFFTRTKTDTGDVHEQLLDSLRRLYLWTIGYSNSPTTTVNHYESLGFSASTAAPARSLGKVLQLDAVRLMGDMLTQLKRLPTTEFRRNRTE